MKTSDHQTRSMEKLLPEEVTVSWLLSPDIHPHFVKSRDKPCAEQTPSGLS